MSSTEDPDDLSRFSAMLARGDAAARQPSQEQLAASRRRRRRSRITGLVVVLAILAGIGTYIPATLLAPAAAAVASTQPHKVAKPAAVKLALPAGAEIAASITGGADFEKLTGQKELRPTIGDNAPLPIASISKLITALVILDAKPLGASDAGPSIVFSKADSKLYDKYYVLHASVAKMSSGSVLSERDALTVMLVASACNYAEALSTWAFGSQSRFLAATRAWLTAHGLSGTTMVEPTGIDAHNVSAPTDLLALGKLALAHPVVAEIVATPSVTIPQVGYLVNNNSSLLGTDGINGIKTGTLEQAGACLLFSAKVSVVGVSPLTVIGVVLGATDHEALNTDVRAFIASLKAGFHTVQLTARGDAYGSYSTPWKSHAKVVAAKSASVLTWSDTPVTSTMRVSKVTTAKDGSPVGSVTFTAGPSTVSVPLVLKGAIKGPDVGWRLTHPQELFAR